MVFFKPQKRRASQAHKAYNEITLFDVFNELETDEQKKQLGLLIQTAIYDKVTSEQDSPAISTPEFRFYTAGITCSVREKMGLDPRKQVRLLLSEQKQAEAELKELYDAPGDGPELEKELKDSKRHHWKRSVSGKLIPPTSMKADYKTLSQIIDEVIADKEHKVLNQFLEQFPSAFSNSPKPE